MRAFTFALLLVIHTANAKTKTEEIRMPNVSATQNDAYLCTSQKVKNGKQYLTHFKPIYTEVTHHMLLFICEEPGSEEPYWNCGHGGNAKPVCNGNEKVLFSWAMKAKEFEMPSDTSFPVYGDKTPFLVLQVHYKDASGFKDLPNQRDNSGWQLTMSDQPTDYLAGIYLFIGDGEVKPQGESIIETACSYNGKADLHPFAFRVHAHSHGLLNYAYIEAEDGVHLIGAKSPQEDQTYYMVQNKSLIIKPDDQLVAKCIMFNEEHRTVYMGNTRQDEMCNFYMMYSVPKEQVDVIFDGSTAGCFDSMEPPVLGEAVNEEDESDDGRDVYEEDGVVYFPE